MYSLNTEHKENGVSVTIPNIPTDKRSGIRFAFIEYLPVERQQDNRRWLVLIDEEFASVAYLDCFTFCSLEAAQYLVLAAYEEFMANQPAEDDGSHYTFCYPG